MLGHGPSSRLRGPGQDAAGAPGRSGTRHGQDSGNRPGRPPPDAASQAAAGPRLFPCPLLIAILFLTTRRTGAGSDGAAAFVAAGSAGEPPQRSHDCQARPLATAPRGGPGECAARHRRMARAVTWSMTVRARSPNLEDAAAVGRGAAGADWRTRETRS